MAEQSSFMGEKIEFQREKSSFRLFGKIEFPSKRTKKSWKGKNLYSWKVNKYGITKSFGHFVQQMPQYSNKKCTCVVLSSYRYPAGHIALLCCALIVSIQTDTSLFFDDFIVDFVQTPTVIQEWSRIYVIYIHPYACG